MVSAASRMPLRPNRSATSPSCAQPPAAKNGSTGRIMTGISCVAAYCKARFIVSVFITGWSPLLIATQPASRNEAISLMYSPLSFFVKAPVGKKRAKSAFFARLIISSADATLSMIGSVSGGLSKQVIPPFVAA